MPGAGSKGKSCTDVKNNVPVNMRGFDKFKKKKHERFCTDGETLYGTCGRGSCSEYSPCCFCPNLPATDDGTSGR